jgi:hypothetical protein
LKARLAFNQSIFRVVLDDLPRKIEGNRLKKGSTWMKNVGCNPLTDEIIRGSALSKGASEEIPL